MTYGHLEASVSTRPWILRFLAASEALYVCCKGKLGSWSAGWLANDAVEHWVLWHVETQGEGMQAKDRHHWHPIELPLRSSTLVARTPDGALKVVGPAGIEPATLSLEG